MKKKTAPATPTEHLLHAKKVKDGLTVKAYRGNGAAMLAFDLEESRAKDLAGFAIRRTRPKSEAEYLPNRISFDEGAHAETPGEKMLAAHPSNEAPFQKFRWIDIPPEIVPGEFRYEVTSMHFGAGGKLVEGQTADISIELMPRSLGRFDFGFTRGYLSSQAYADHFKNALIRPAKKSLDYNTKSYQKQYEWLGSHARKLVFDFVEECLKDKSVTVDLFAYDLDEPDFVRAMQKLGKRLRAYLDNAPLHTKPGALEIEAHKLFVKSAGAGNVKQGHFHRFAHNKVMIQKRNGKPVKVLTGSANFSVRGLYVQANNILVFDDPAVAELYEAAFEQAFQDAPGFAASELAEGWHDVESKGIPKFSVAFSPHKKADVSLARVADAIKNAKSSVLFAVMELAGGGTVMDELKALPASKTIFSYGMTQALSGVKVYPPGNSEGLIVPYAYLSGKVPPPFQDEYTGGAGIVIHDKFVVCDFNGDAPVVFTGSSNLAAGGEEANGDNLLAIYDPAVAVAYGVEAVRLVDHYHFRAAIKGAKADAPFTLQGPEAKEKWWQPYYAPKDIRCHEREVFSK
jgi:phosphatidylserine/phosphatidylglycerophosphate/cardiolipin synthase-like enzyme